MTPEEAQFAKPIVEVLLASAKKFSEMAGVKWDELPHNRQLDYIRFAASHIYIVATPEGVEVMSRALARQWEKEHRGK